MAIYADAYYWFILQSCQQLLLFFYILLQNYYKNVIKLTNKKFSVIIKHKDHKGGKTNGQSSNYCK